MMQLLPLLLPLLATEVLGQGGLHLRSLDVVSGIRMRFATTKVRAIIENAGFRAAEYHFVSYLPEAAFVTNFTMEVDNYQSIAILRERSAADDLFQVAKKAGATAATTSADANVFTTKVNIGAGKRISFELTYEEVLTRAHGVYKHVVNVQPNLEVDAIRARVRIVERGRIDRDKLRVPQFGYALAAKDNAQLLKAPQESGVLVKSSLTDDVSIVDITFEPSSSGQLVVLYDVERGHDAGYLEVVNGYFVHFFAPPVGSEMKRGSQNFVYLLDSSYSMCGQRWDSVKKAIRIALGSLTEADHFNILTVNAQVHAWGLSSKPATQANIADALDYLGSVSHEGGSNFNDGLRYALDLLRIDEADPMISSLVFITDGYASQGVVDSSRIVRDVTKMNAGRKWAIHTLALGREADTGLLAKLSSYNRGISRRVYEDGSSDVSGQIAGFFRELSSPLLRDVKIKYLDGNVNMRTLVAQQGPAARTYWDGGEILIAGKLKVVGTAEDGRTVNLTAGGSVRRLRKDSSGGFLERIWGFLQIKDLLRTAAASVSPVKRTQQRAKALTLAKRFNFVTELTSLLVIPLELRGSEEAEPRFPAPDGVVGADERSPVIRLVGEELAGDAIRSRDNGRTSRLNKPEMVAGTPLEESVVAVDKIRAELGPGSDNVGIPSSQSGILEHNAIAIDPLSNVDLSTLITIANPAEPSNIDGIWRNSYVGPTTRSTQGYARLLSSLSPATRHAAAKFPQRRCGDGQKLDIILALDVSESLDAPLGGPGAAFLLRSLAQRLVAALAFARLDTRIGLVVFAPNADKSEQIYSLNWNQNANALINIIGKIDASAANGDKYLNVFNLSYDMLAEKGREDAEKVIVLMSSQDSYGRHRTIADTMRKRGIKILAVAPHQRIPSKLAQLSFVAGEPSHLITQPDLSALLAPFCNNFQPPRVQ